MNSRMKGKRGELEFAEVLRSYGHEARRGVQFKGGVDSPDVVCSTLPDVHFEVKRTEKGNIYDWMNQASRDAGSKLPVVAHRRNGKEWLAVLPMDQFLHLLRAFDDATHRRTESSHTRVESATPGSQRRAGQSPLLEDKGLSVGSDTSLQRQPTE